MTAKRWLYHRSSHISIVPLLTPQSRMMPKTTPVAKRQHATLTEARQNVSTSSPLAFSLLVSHPKGRDRCRTLQAHLRVQTARRGRSGGVSELNRVHVQSVCSQQHVKT